MTAGAKAVAGDGAAPGVRPRDGLGVRRRATGRRPRSRARRWPLLFTVVALAIGHSVGLAGALAADESASRAPGKVVLKLGWTEDPDNLNPFIGYENSSWEIWSLQYDFLFFQYPNGDSGPELALERPTVANGGISPDGKVWTVKIRPGVKWQDGTPLTANDVAFTYNYILEGGLWNFTVLTAGIDHVEAVDPTTVKIVCKAPKADMLTAVVPILPKHIWESVKPRAAQSTYQNKPPIIGSGPFQVVEVKKGGYVKMVRNPDYRGKQPTVDEIDFVTYTNPDTMTMDLKLGAIDGAVGIPRAQFPALKTDEALDTSKYNVLAFEYCVFNCKEGPSKGNPILRDREFRRALCQAIDRQKIVDVTYGGLAEPGTTVISPDTWSNPDYHWQPDREQELAFDLDKARQALEAAGYTDSNGDGVREDKTNGTPIRLRLWTTANSPEEQSEGKLIAGWWIDIGIDVRYEVLDTGALNDRFWNYEGDIYAPDFDVYISNTMGFADPGETVPWFVTEQIGNWNEPCWSNAEYDELSVEQIGTIDPQRRAEMIWRMQEIMYEDAVYPVLAYPQKLQAYNTDKWEDWVPLGFGGIDGPGPTFSTSYNVETYLNLKPAVASSGETGGSSTTTIVVIAAIAVIVAGVVVWLVVARRRRREETMDEL